MMGGGYSDSYAKVTRCCVAIASLRLLIHDGGGYSDSYAKVTRCHVAIASLRQLIHDGGGIVIVTQKLQDVTWQ